MAIIRVKCVYCTTINPTDFGPCKRCGGPLRGGVKLLTFPFTLALPATPSAYNVVGVDVSVWQGHIDFDIMERLVHFLYMRSSYGNKGVDGYFARNKQECIDRDIAFGCYHYLKPELSYAKQAVHFAGLIAGSQLPPVMDVESTGGLNKTQLHSWLYKFMRDFENIAQREVCIYTSPGFWNSYLPLTSWAKLKPLWVANWTNAAEPTLPHEWAIPGKAFTFWQHSADGNGQGPKYGASSRSIDLNRYNGTLDQFNTQFGTDVQPLPTTPPSVPDSVIINTSVLNMRLVPTTSGNTRVATTYRNIPWSTTGKLAADQYGREWIQVKGDLWLARWLTRDA